MADVRPLEAGDLDGVAGLFVRAFRKDADQSLGEIARYFRQLYLENPWVDPEMPSLVIDRDGAIAGFMGVVPLPVRLDGRAIRLAVGGNLMADVDGNDPMATVRLMRRYFAGPHDLALTDTANEQAVRLWTSLGGAVARFHSMRWLVPLRPGSLGLAGVARHPVGARAARLGRPFAWPVDRVSRRRLLAASELAVRDIDPVRVHDFTHTVGDRRYVHVDADAAGFQWLVDMCRAKAQFGPLRSLAFVDRAGREVGVVMYYPNRRGIGQVLLLLAREGKHGAVLDTLCSHAAEEGSAALMGQADPRLMVELGSRVSTYVQRNEFVTVRGNSALAAPIVAGDVSLGRLVGEWWTRMQGDRF